MIRRYQIAVAPHFERSNDNASYSCLYKAVEYMEKWFRSYHFYNELEILSQRFKILDTMSGELHDWHTRIKQ